MCLQVCELSEFSFNYSQTQVSAWEPVAHVDDCCMTMMMVMIQWCLSLPKQMRSVWKLSPQVPDAEWPSRHRASCEMIRWRERPGLTAYCTFIVMWARHASSALHKRPIGSSTGPISTRQDQKKKRKLQQPSKTLRIKEAISQSCNEKQRYDFFQQWNS